MLIAKMKIFYKKLLKDENCNMKTEFVCNQKNKKLDLLIDEIFSNNNNKIKISYIEKILNGSLYMIYLILKDKFYCYEPELVLIYGKHLILDGYESLFLRFSHILYFLYIFNNFNRQLTEISYLGIYRAFESFSYFTQNYGK